MPILTPPLPDPTDIVIAGQVMGVSVVPRIEALPATSPMLQRASFDAGFSSLVGDEDGFLPMNSFIEINLLSMRRLNNGALQVRAGAGIATPCGAWVFLDYSPLIPLFVQASVRWVLTGVTRDLASAPLTNCRVVVLETGRIAMDGAPVVTETISNGGGNYSVSVPMNTAYQAIAYKPGSPEVAGITRADIVPVAE